jgi:hypothetical protein
VPIDERDAHDSPATRFNQLAPDNRVFSPVRAFYQDVRLQSADDLLRVVFVEHDHGIDRRQRCQNFGAFAFRVDGARRPLDGADGSIGIHRDDQRIAFTPGIVQVPHVTRMKKIEYTVGQHDFLSAVPQVLGKCYGFCD